MTTKHLLRSTLFALSLAGACGAAATGCKSSGNVSRGPHAAPQGSSSAAALLGPAPGAADSATASGAPQPPASSPGVPPDANMARAEIPAQYKWNLDQLFTSDQGFEQAFAAVGEQRKRLAGYQGKLPKASELRACLALYFETRLATNKLTLYANLRQDSDQKSSKLSEMNQRAQDALRALISGATFIRQEVQALDDRAMAAAYKSEPKLEQYKPYVDELRRRRKHVLNADGEKVLSLAGDNLWAEIDLNEIPSDIELIYKALRAELSLPTIQDEKGQSVQLTFSNYNKYRSSPDRATRQRTVDGMLGALRRNENSFAASLGGQIRYDIFLARSRGYDTALAAYLDKENVDPAVYHNLIRTINANLAPLHRYVALRKKLMSLPELRLCDLYPPLAQAGPSRTIPYGEALSILPEALAPLGDDYLKVLRQGLSPQSGWIDVYPHKDKDSGAFSVSVYTLHPYVKLNYMDDPDDVSTLAHEYGHALHTFLASKKQPYWTSNYSTLVAEIASTFNEKLLSDYLLAHAKSDAEKLAILTNLVDTIRQTIYRQTLFAEFELATHTAAEQGTPLTAAFFDKTYAELVRRYYGPDFTLGPNDGMEWAYVPHFYYKYYVYAYATGLSAGIALAEKVQKSQKDGSAARDAYLGMLSGGSSKPPLELVKGAGVDLTKPEAIEAAARLMNETVAQLEAILLAKK